MPRMRNNDVRPARIIIIAVTNGRCSAMSDQTDVTAFSQHVAAYIRCGFGIGHVVNPFTVASILYMLDLGMRVTNFGKI